MAEPEAARGEIRRLLDQVASGALDAAQAIRQCDTARIDGMFLPALKASSVAGLPKWRGGLCGSPGVAAGRACFSSAALLEAKRQARRGAPSADGRLVLVLPAVFAGDVPALEAAEGTLTAQGGYASHAAVLARQRGKPSLVAPELSLDGSRAVLGDLCFNEGDYITLDARAGEVYRGAAELTSPEIDLPGLRELLALAEGFINTFQVRANADTPEEAELARSLGACGIGLCRTEHMFFSEDRINRFRDLILAESRAERDAALEQLLPLQRADFCRIFKIMAGKPVVVRLLDAPLHEFMPRGDGELEDYLAHCAGPAGTPRSKEEVLERIETLRETNPLLGRRGCRVAVSYPEIYAMQVRAVFEAAAQLRDERLAVLPEILVPLAMNAAELRLIAYGKQAEEARRPGILDEAEAFRNETGADPPRFRIGAMIELPAAALGAGDLARYAQFFSFGTNDLTQTALGLSRDDAAAFLDAYSRYDLLGGNPFSVLDERVKELIALAVERGRLTRPDLVCGLCGEQASGAARFCLDAGLDYLSCPPYAVPGAILAAAQAALSPSKTGPTVYAGTRT